MEIYAAVHFIFKTFSIQALFFFLTIVLLFNTH